MKLVFGVGACFDLSYTALEEIRVSPKNEDTSFWIFVPNSGHKISPRQVDRVVNKTRRRSSLLTTRTTGEWSLVMAGRT